MSPSRRTRGRPVAIGCILLTVLAVSANGCAKKKPNPGNYLSAEEIYHEALAELQADDLRDAQSLLEQITYQADNRAELEPLVRVAIADATFYQAYGVALIDARSLYLDFVALYGDHDLAPYAQFMAGVCSLGQVAHPSRDQSQTHQAIADLQVVLKRWPGSRFAAAARSMIGDAQYNLAEHDFTVGKFYLNRKAPTAAIQRFQMVLDSYPAYREKDKLYYYLGQAELKAGNDSDARLYLGMVVSDYPHGEFAAEAQRALTKLGSPPSELKVTSSN